MRFGLLGPLQVSRNGAELAVRGGKSRVLLAALLLNAGRLVPVDRLIAALWDDMAPATAKASLHNHVHALPARRVAFRPLDRLTAQTCLAVPPVLPDQPSGAFSLPVIRPARPAIANAVWHATGRRQRVLPIRLDRVVEELS